MTRDFPVNSNVGNRGQDRIESRQLVITVFVVSAISRSRLVATQGCAIEPLVKHAPEASGLRHVEGERRARS
jgi:hypothetical protein